MKTGTQFTITAALMASLTIGAIAYAAPAAREAGHRRGMLGERLASLGLTDEQKARLKDTLQAHKATVKPLVDKLVAERRALQDLIHTGKADEAAVRAQAGKIAAVEADLAVERAKIVAELRPVLTEEQIKKLQEMKGEFRDRVDQFRERVAKHRGE